MNIGPNHPIPPFLVSNTTPNSWKALWDSSFSPAYLFWSLLRLFKASSPGPWEQLTKIRNHSPERTSGDHRKGTWSQRDLERDWCTVSPPQGNMDDAIQSLARTPLLRIKRASLAGLLKKKPGHLDLKKVLVTDNVNTPACWPVVVVLS